ncbi:MAG: hypothetical protein MK098_07580 [Marinovum sp.]|nr:hypothetical protein [Marinovum sp.]
MSDQEGIPDRFAIAETQDRSLPHDQTIWNGCMIVENETSGGSGHRPEWISILANLPHEGDITKDWIALAVFTVRNVQRNYPTHAPL